MTTYSQTEWATRALQKSSIVAGDETPSADLSAWAVDVGTSLFEQLLAEGIDIVNGSDLSLPGEYLQSFASIVACDLKSEVGLMSEADAEAAKIVYKKTFRRMNARPATGAVTKAEYF